MRLGSPVIDLHYNIFASSDKELRQKEYHNLMNYYHKTLSETIQKLGSDPDQLFTYQNFQDQLKKFSKYAFLMGPLFAMTTLAGTNDIPDLDDLCNDLGTKDYVDFVKEFTDEVQQKEYEKKVNDLLTDLVELGYY